MASTARKLLVATPTLLDPNFFRTVVFMIEHTDEAAFGVVINRPTTVAVTDALPEWSAVAAAPPVVFVGGPVQAQEALIGLARSEHEGPADGWHELLGDVGTVDLGREPVDVQPVLSSARVFAGYAAWGAGQLDGELALSGWFVVDALPDDVLTAEPEGLWRAVLRRQGGELAIAANFPLDPRAN